MSRGRFIAAVGPSGVGKDSVIAALCAARPGLVPARRVITRPADAGGEDHLPAAPADFDAQAAAGGFVLSWRAHGLSYGIPATVQRDLAAGRDVIANLSRAALPVAAERLSPVIVLALTARAETLALRLAGRGRETAEDIRARLARDGADLPPGLPVVRIGNDGSLTDTVAAALAALYPVKA